MSPSSSSPSNRGATSHSLSHRDDADVHEAFEEVLDDSEYASKSEWVKQAKREFILSQVDSADSVPEAAKLYAEELEQQADDLREEANQLEQRADEKEEKADQVRSIAARQSPSGEHRVVIDIASEIEQGRTVELHQDARIEEVEYDSLESLASRVVEFADEVDGCLELPLGRRVETGDDL